jgi:hypothetical protein
VSTNPKSKNSVLVDLHIGDKEIMPSPTKAEPKSSACATGGYRFLKWALPDHVQVTPRSNGNPKVGWGAD